MEKGRAVGAVDDLAVELDRHARGVRLAFGPPAVIGRNFADGSDQTRAAVGDGDEMADRPLLLVHPERATDDALRSVQSYKAPDDARRLGLPPVEQERLRGVILLALASPAGRDRQPRSARVVRLADPFESVAKKLAVGAKRMHVGPIGSRKGDGGLSGRSLPG